MQRLIYLGIIIQEFYEILRFNFLKLFPLFVYFQS